MDCINSYLSYDGIESDRENMMMGDVMINVENVSKKYCKSLKRSMLYGISDIGKNIIGLSSRSFKLRKDEFWGVNGVSFKLKKGETLGVIGRNGSGKSTLLKMLNGIFWPDKGKITIRGKVGALIEVGAGFHPMLTGKENIFLNGAILGMNKKEIIEKFDRIVEFAEIGEFINTPVKYYSSGMFVRLGFSIAVHSEPDILLVDEVLSVGDLNFQAKSKKKIIDLLEKGVSIVLVSHNLNLISNLCKRTLLLSKKRKYVIGDTIKVIDQYRESILSEGGKEKKYGTGEISIEDIKILNEDLSEAREFGTDDKMVIRIYFYAKEVVSDPIFTVGIFDLEGTQITGIRSDVDNIKTGEFSGKGTVDLILDKLSLLPGIYSVSSNIYEKRALSFYSRVINMAQFKVSGGKRVYGYVEIPHRWEF